MEPKININRPKVDDAEIESRKNFDDLVNKFKSESLQKAKKDLRLRRLKKLVYSTVIAGATVFCTVTYFNYKAAKDKEQTIADNKKNKSSLTELSDKKSTAYINPLTNKTNVNYSKYKINAKHGGTITHNKTKITVPAASFVKKTGEEINGEVEILYREMKDQAEILASGIPMTYDSAGTTYHFESAGMIDIKGEQNGQEVFVKHGKKIKVEMASAEQGTQFNLYALDTVSRNWVFIEKDIAGSTKESHSKTKTDTELKNPSIVAIDKKIEVIEHKKDSVVVLSDKKIVALPKTIAPNQPRESKEGRPKFELDVDPAEHPELAMYKDVTFEIGEENKQYDKKTWGAITWSDAQLSDGPKKGENYILNLYLGQRHEKLVVYPALTGKSLEKATKEYQKKFDQYQAAVKKRADDEARIKKDLEEKLAAYNEQQAKLAQERQKQIIKIRNEQEKQLTNQFNSISQETQITRTFMVSNFGVYNSDCPNSLPTGERVSAIFMQGNFSLKPHQLFMVSHDKNMLITIPEDKFSVFNVPASGNYSLCCSVNNTVYVCDKKEFRNAKLEDGKTIFNFSPINPEVASVYDLRKGLGLIN